MPFQNIDQVKNLDAYAATLQVELNSTSQKPKRYRLYEKFKATDGVRSVLLVGKVPGAVKTGVKNAGGKMKASGFCQKVGSEIQFTVDVGSVTEQKFKDAGARKVTRAVLVPTLADAEEDDDLGDLQDAEGEDTTTSTTDQQSTGQQTTTQQTPPLQTTSQQTTTQQTTTQQPPPQQPTTPWAQGGVSQQARVQRATRQLGTVRQAVEGFKGNPAGHLATVRSQLQASNALLLTSLDEELNDTETNRQKIQKKRKLLPNSKDRKYHRDVTTPVQTTLAQIRQALADPTNTGNILQALKDAQALRKALEKPYAYYAGKSQTDPDDDQPLDQRGLKAESIRSHQNDLRAMEEQMRGLLRLQVQPALTALQALPLLVKQAPGELATAGKEVADMLNDATNPALREALIQSLDARTAAGFALALHALPGTDNQSEQTYKDIIATHADNPALLEQLATEAIRLEAENTRLTSNDLQQARGIFFRGETPAIKLIKQYNRGTRDNQEYMKNTARGLHGPLRGVRESVEVDPNKVRDVYKERVAKERERQKLPALNPGQLDAEVNRLYSNEIQAQITRGEQETRRLATEMLDSVTSDPATVPEDLARLASEFYEQALLTTNGDEDFAVTQVGGFLMLRMVAPLVFPGFSLTNDAEAKSKNPQVKQQAEDQRRAAALTTKILQNMANGVKPGNKEGYMAPFNDFVEDTNGQPAPAVVKMRQFMKDVATRGQISKNRQKIDALTPTLNDILAHPKGVQAFREVLVAQRSEENLDFLLAVQNNPTGGAAQQVYNQFIASRAPQQINAEDVRDGLDSCAARNDWSNPPWGPVVQHIRQIMTNDSYAKLIRNKDQWDKVRLAMV